MPGKHYCWSLACTALRRIVHLLEQIFFSKYSRDHMDLKYFQIKFLALFSHLHFFNVKLRPLQRPQIIIHSFEQLKSNYLRFNSLSELPTILCLCSNHCVFNPEYSEITNYVCCLRTLIWFSRQLVFLQGQLRVWRSSFSFLFFLRKKDKIFTKSLALVILSFSKF